MSLSDILFALFKRKWTIILCALLGMSATAAIYFFYPRTYASQAKLLVRYVLERSAVDSVESTNAAPSRDPRAAAQPMTGGSAPGNAPTTVESEVRVLSGV